MKLLQTRQLAKVFVGVIGLLAVSFVALAITNGVFVSGTVPLDAADGPQVDVEFSSDTEMDLQDPFPDNNTVEVTTEDGEVVFSSAGSTSATVHTTNITGTYTTVSGLGVASNDLTVNPEDKPAITVGGDTDRVKFADPNLDDGGVDFTYVASSGTTTITLNGVPANTDIGAIDQNGGMLQVSTSDSSGRVTFSSLENSGVTDVELVTTAGAPTISDLSPEGDLNKTPSDISANVSDPDFGADNVSVTFTLDGSEIDTQHIQSNQTVTTSIPSSGQTAGKHTYTIEAEDAYGNIDSESSSYNVPGTLYIRNETNTSELVDSPVDVTVRFFGDDQIHSRSASGGTVDMSGLPVDEQFVVEVDASQDYGSRTVFIDSLYEQQDVYLLPNNVDNVSSRFILDDPTGQFNSETLLYIEKPINQSGTVQYRTIHADRFGSEGVTAVLEQGARYRLSVERGGVSQDIGPYRAEESETVTVQPGTPSIDLEDFEDGWAADATIDNDTIEYVFKDPEELTDRLVISVYEKGNKSNTLGPDRTELDPVNVSGTYSLNKNQTDMAWVVEFEITRNGETFTVKREVMNRPDLVGDLGDDIRLVIGIGILFVSAGIFSMLNAGVGGVVVAIEGGVLWWTGWLGGATAGAAVVIALFIAIVMHIYRSTGP